MHSDNPSRGSNQVNKLLDLVLTVVLIVVALVVGAGALRGPRPPKPPNLIQEAQDSKAFAKWRSIDSAGYILAGSPNSPVSITVFTDVQCPACRGFHRTIHAVLEEHPNDVKVVYVSLPLQYHEYAMPGARATDCIARAGGNIRKWFDAIYTKQDSLAVLSWATLARLSEVVDTAAITSCASGKDSAAVAAVRRGEAWAAQIEASATPTVLVNGHKLIKPPTAAQLDTLIRAFSKSS